jgi:hypothetical protein
LHLQPCTFSFLPFSLLKGYCHEIECPKYQNSTF